MYIDYYIDDDTHIIIFHTEPWLICFKRVQLQLYNVLVTLSYSWCTMIIFIFKHIILMYIYTHVINHYNALIYCRF